MTVGAPNQQHKGCDRYPSQGILKSLCHTDYKIIVKVCVTQTIKFKVNIKCKTLISMYE